MADHHPRFRLHRPFLRWRHKARGTVYCEIGTAELQTAAPVAEGTLLVIYSGENSKLWARPVDEFLDGRFERVTE